MKSGINKLEVEKFEFVEDIDTDVEFEDERWICDALDKLDEVAVWFLLCLSPNRAISDTNEIDRWKGELLAVCVALWSVEIFREDVTDEDRCSGVDENVS